MPARTFGPVAGRRQNNFAVPTAVAIGVGGPANAGNLAPVTADFDLPRLGTRAAQGKWLAAFLQRLDELGWIAGIICDRVSLRGRNS